MADDAHQNESGREKEHRITLTIGFTPTAALLKALRELPEGATNENYSLIRGILAREAGLSLDNLRIVALAGSEFKPDSESSPESQRAKADIYAVGQMFEGMISGQGPGKN